MDDDIRFEDVPDGCGCAEIWEHMSEKRREDDESDGQTEEQPNT